MATAIRPSSLLLPCSQAGGKSQLSACRTNHGCKLRFSVQAACNTKEQCGGEEEVAPLSSKEGMEAATVALRSATVALILPAMMIATQLVTTPPIALGDPIEETSNAALSIPSTALAAPPVAVGEAAGDEVASLGVQDGATEGRGLVETLLQRSRANKAKYDQERLESYYRRNFTDYFSFSEGNLERRSELSDTQKQIQEWLNKNK